MSIFKTFQKDRKIGLTNFDLSFQNLSTANFGELRPVGCYPVLPKDKWKIGSNILTKVEPMPAPAFTRIKQNVYSFFTPNQSVWKHWNDFVSNGTAYADTYGNNSNTQKVDNLWREPQIPANYVQLISKIANGWAIPVFHVASTHFENIIKFLFRSLPSSVSTNLTKLFKGSDNYIYWNTQKFQVLLLAAKLLSLDKASELSTIFDDIPYFEIATNPSQSQTLMDIGCDFYTALKFHKFLDQLNGIYSSAKNIQPTQEVHKDYDQSEENNFYAASIRCFCDNVSDDVELNHGPFSLEKRSAVDPVSHKPFTYYAYKKNKYIDNTSKSDSAFYKNAQGDYFSKRETRFCGYFWSSDIIQICSAGNAQSSSPYAPYYLNGVAFNPDSATPPTFDLLSILGVDLENLLSYDDLLTLHNFKNNFNDIFYDTSISAYSSIPEVGSWTQLSDTSGNISFTNPFYIGSSFTNTTETIELFTHDYTNFVDVNLPIFYYLGGVGLNHNHCGSLPMFNLFSFESFNLGYDAWSFIVYCCKNSCKLIDSINIPLEGLTSRPWSDYAGEFLKMILPFTYSKIWNDYFRNKVTSSAELDYRETNSVGCFDDVFNRFLSLNYVSDSLSIPKWIEDTFLDQQERFNYKNSWSIPFSCAPKNALDDAQIDIDGNGTFLKVADFNHFHDLRIRNHWTLFSVLTGAQLFEISLNNIIHFYTQTPSKELFGILANKLYLPSYYNGLLHLKYQNFNKDYFSSALLDPASGANDEEIGTTVSSLVTAQAKQGFWNQLAQNRSLKQFWNRMFDIDPSHDDYDKPLLLGSNHTDINVGEVVQLSQTDTTPQGMRSGLGSAHDKSALCNKQFNEHGYIIILCSHTLELQYMQGLEKDFTPNESFLDLPFIDFVGLGNQNILQKELNFTTKPKFTFQPVVKSSLPAGSQNDQYDNFYQFYGKESKIDYSYPTAPHFLSRLSSSALNDDGVHLSLNLANGSGQNLNETFGFIPRYSTWKMKLDQVHGEFRNQLAFWHSFRKFFTQPILCHEFVNWEFVAENDELNRMFFVIDNSTDKFKLDIFINATAARPLPYVCTPATSK